MESQREENEKKRSGMFKNIDVEALEEVKRELEKLKKVKEEKDMKEVEDMKEVKDMEEVEANIYFPSHYSPSGCPTVPLVFSGMTGREISTLTLTTNTVDNTTNMYPPLAINKHPKPNVKITKKFTIIKTSKSM